MNLNRVQLKINFAFLLGGFLLLGSQFGFCQVPETSVGGLPQDIGDSWFSNPKIVSGLKSNTSFGRPADYDGAPSDFRGRGKGKGSGAAQDPNVPGAARPSRGRKLMSRNEVYVGARASSGWGIFGYYNYSVRQFINANNDNTGPEDPSLAILNPFYDDNIVKVSGQFRQYFPLSERSGPKQTYGEAYSATVFYKMPYRLDLGNVVNARYFLQPGYQPEDALYSFALSTSLSRHVTSWCRIGIGQHTGLEIHSGTGTGILAQVSPSASFFITKTMFIGPRVSFPVYISGATYEGPRVVSTNQMQGELTFEAQL